MEEYTSDAWCKKVKDDAAARKHGWRSNKYRKEHEHKLLTKIWIVLVDNLIAGVDLLMRGTPYVLYGIYASLFQSKQHQLPYGIKDLVDKATFSRLSGRQVKTIEYSEQKEQHANSTDRAWIRVVYADDKNSDREYRMFAKCHAKSYIVSAMLTIFGIYSNEVTAYSTIEFPIPVPKAHVSKISTTRFILALEDLTPEGVIFPNTWETKVGKSLGKQVLSAQAKLHAKYWGDNVPSTVWNDSSRPLFSKMLGVFTLFNLEKRCPGLISSDAHKVFMQALMYFDVLRSFYSRRGPNHPKCLNHGDSHIGNYFIKPDGTIGAYDFQVLGEEHPMRDVSYFLCCSYDPDALEKDEKELIMFYLHELEKAGLEKEKIPSFENCWLNYRLHSWYCLYAWVFSGGLSNLMDELQTSVGVGRILRAMDRIDSAGALYDLLDGKLRNF